LLTIHSQISASLSKCSRKKAKAENGVTN